MAGSGATVEREALVGTRETNADRGAVALKSSRLRNNTWIQSGSDPLLVSGTTAHAQYWYRDPASPITTGLSNALSFTIRP